MEQFVTFLRYKDKNSSSSLPSLETVIELKEKIMDSSYWDFIEVSNGGFFYGKSLSIYAIDSNKDYNDIQSINNMIRKEYSRIIDDEYFFGEEIFGNQFGFSGKGIVFFNIETGEKEYIAQSFKEWLKVIDEDLDYYTGKNLSLEWNTQNEELKFNERLCPKKPFIIGGEYKVDNLYRCSYPSYFSTNANIANQVFDLPDGTPIKLKIVD
ncbi:SMI1/KNR4 family protein [Mucilaginibacter lacusdianchii]|uniref:SMI1/KNR4 family protein n=1 Tax=Mucilaginibacter lacusdianchii TaxID=2684211 RepID=UPI00131B0A67|nr:SMI1/KNR4 family protein [Mucilaginibacter sp. JXJ CY 39]